MSRQQGFNLLTATTGPPAQAWSETLRVSAGARSAPVKQLCQLVFLVDLLILIEPRHGSCHAAPPVAARGQGEEKMSSEVMTWCQ